MLPIAQIIDDNFPATLTDVPTMPELVEMRTKLVAALPPDTSVEVRAFMNTVTVEVYVLGGSKHTRTIVVKQ